VKLRVHECRPVRVAGPSGDPMSTSSSGRQQKFACG
jgi:hypothetical protein